MSRKKNRSPICPYLGPMAEGWRAFHRGVSLNANPYGNSQVSSHGKAFRWDGGWRKAKLASEQNKRSV